MLLRSAVAKLWTFASAPGVASWGLPVAVVFAVWTTWRSLGYAWANLLTISFLVRLAVAIVIIGVCGGRMFGAHMARFGLPLRRPRNRD